MAWLGQILTTELESYRPKYTDELIIKLNFLVHNLSFHTLCDNDGLQGGNTSFCGSKDDDVSQENGVSMENRVIPCNSNSNLDVEDTKAQVDINGVLKMVKQKKKLHAKMRGLKQKMNTSDEMLKKQRQLLHQFQHIERHNKQNWKNHTSYGKSIDYLAKSPILRSKMKHIKEHKKNKRNKKKNFLLKGRFKQAADS